MSYALLSVSDKSGITVLARGLIEVGYKIISSGGTYAALQAEGIPAMRVSDYTGSPEILDGRVKTLHPKIHGGILAQRGNSSHDLDLKVNRIEHIDIVVVNLYPFKQTIEKEGVTFEEAIENIDIGGPSMVRSAAKNHKHVSVLTNPNQYGMFIDVLKNNLVSVKLEDMRPHLAQAAFLHTAEYDHNISNWITECLN